MLSFDEFINESREVSLNFKVDESGKADIRGSVFTVKELLSGYSHMIEYLFATYFDKRLMYFPRDKKFRIVKAPGENGQVFNISTDSVKWRSVKVMPEFITEMELEYVMKKNKDAADFRDKKTYVEILDLDGNVIDTYQVDKKTGELK